MLKKEATAMVRIIIIIKVGIFMKHPRTGLHYSFNENDLQGCINQPDVVNFHEGSAVDWV